MEPTSKYRIQIFDTDTQKVVFETLPGMAVERNLVEEVTNRAVAKGVGYFRSEAKVKQAIGEAFRELLHDLKSLVPAK